MTLPTPPRYVVIPEEVIEQAYRPDKPRRALLASFTRILSLAWEAKYERTPALNEQELMEFLKLSRRQYFEQKADMELLGWLRSSHPRPGFVQFTFSRSMIDKATTVTSAENRTPGAENRTDSGGGGEELINPITESPPPPQQGASAENRTFPSVVEILRHTDKLFNGSVVHAKGLETRSPLEALAWCAYAYSNLRRLDAPAGLVRARLLEEEPAPLWTTEQWPSILPADFLEALRLVVYVCDLCEATFDTRADMEAHEQTHPDPEQAEAGPVSMETDESVRAPIDGRLTAVQAWQAVLGRLQMEMPRASFDTWVQNSRAVRFDGNTLYVGARNGYARDWLADRIRSTAVRLLVGILGRSVDVAFVVVAGVDGQAD